MLSALAIRDIVLIEHLELHFGRGLTVLTGETGAGKSILLDALSLVLGVRGRADLVRPGAAQGQIVATFELPLEHHVFAMLDSNEVPSAPGEVILRRVQMQDGRTKAYINDTPVSLPLLRGVGAALVEIHGQHDARALIDAAYHLDLLDSFGLLEKEVSALSEAWDHWRKLQREIEDKKKALEEIARDREYIEHSLEEIAALDPEEGEEEVLAEKRHLMMKSETLAKEIDGALEFLGGPTSPTADLSALVRRLARHASEFPDLLAEGVDQLSEVMDQLSFAEQFLQTARDKTAFNPYDLERMEERLFALRGLARKHKVTCDDLVTLQAEFIAKLEEVKESDLGIQQLEQACKEAEKAYHQRAEALSDKRVLTAKHLEKLVAAELPPLKLGAADFYVELGLDKARPGRKGYDQAAFHVRTNPGAEGGLIGKVASGGELSRFTLALKAALATQTGASTLIFDEVDTGVGGAVADAIGTRLARLAERSQLLAVTHAPQVAVKAHQHLLISKGQNKREALPVTAVRALTAEEQQEEIARMLAGASITEEARAAAGRLLAGEQVPSE